MSFLNWLVNLILNLFVDTSYSLGAKVFEQGNPWKLSSLTKTKHGLFVGVYNSDSRHDSKLFLNGNQVWSGNAETIGQGLEHGNSVYFAGENGKLLTWNNGSITAGISLNFATCCAEFSGVPYVFDTRSNIIYATNILTGAKVFTMPGSGIVTQAVEKDGVLYTAASDGAGGVANSNGKLISLPNCQCVVEYAGHLLCSSGNRIMEISDDKATEIATLPCEKIMHMYAGDVLFVAGSNPDALWVLDRLLNSKLVCSLSESAAVGGSVFMARVTDGYFGRSAGGKRAEVYEIKE
jgi:hypothetical protein